MNEVLSTYRIQLRPEFGFDDVARIAPYLAALGVSHVYLSPHLQAVAGSTHGYDIVDHSHVNLELGGPEGHSRMGAALQAAGLGQIIDIVPNHMAIPGRENAWWWDVLKHGPTSRFATHFDIDWEALGDNRLLLPVLGQRYGDVLASGEFTLSASEDGVVVRYFDNEFPLSGVDVDEIGTGVMEAEAMHELLERQHYRLAFWQLAADELEYRRFFDINTLMALHSERQDVFDAVHALPAQWAKDGVIDGVRVDHVDGLANPAEYLQRVRSFLGDDGYLVVEKILEPGERLRASWPIQGTTGYDVLRLIDGLFVDSANQQAFTDVYMKFTDYESDWSNTVADCKHAVVDELFGSDVYRLAGHLRRVADKHPRSRDYSLTQIQAVVVDLLVAFDVYRAYVIPEAGYIADADENVIYAAADAAKTKLSSDLHDLVDFTTDVLTLKLEGEIEADFVRRFQQVSGPVMAKGVEDTAGYRYNRLVVLNEVGGAADRFGVRPEEFHEDAAEALKNWPQRMIAATTHDTKRSEDFRYRLALLSEIPDQWADALERWRAINDKHRRNDDSGQSRLDANTEYLLYETLVGAYPIDTERLCDYMLKATREARALTSWQAPDESYEQSLLQFIAAIDSDGEFQSALTAFVEPLIGLGRINSLAALVLRMTTPGVPDLYQGSELWNLSLVDPDNRRPVDYAVRADLLDEVMSLNAPPTLTDDEGRAKLFVVTRLLHLRRARPELFDKDAVYVPLVSFGDRAANVVAFKRGDAIVIVPRLARSLDSNWNDTYVELPDGSWHDLFTGSTFGAKVKLADLLTEFPVAYLVGDR